MCVYVCVLGGGGGGAQSSAAEPLIIIKVHQKRALCPKQTLLTLSLL